MKWLDGVDLKQSVHSLEDGIITLSGPALAVSSILAIVDILTGGHLLQQYTWFTLSWAICLALTLDFQVLALGALAHQNYLTNKPRNQKLGEMALAIGIASAIAFVSIQMQSIIARVNGSSVSVDTAAAQLGINTIWLAWERSGLVLLLIFLSGWFRVDSKQKATATNEQANISQAEIINQLVQKMETLATSITQITTTVTEVKEFTQNVRYEQAVIPEVANSVASNLTISPNQANESNGLKEPLAVSPKRGLIKEAIAKALANGEKLDYKAIAQQTGAGYSTVKLYAPEIKQELGQLVHQENRK